jgi:hypothetical protein
LFYLAICLQEIGRYPDAVATLRRLTELYPTSSRGHAQLGVLLSTFAPGAEPDLAEAFNALERSKQINYEQTGPFIRQGMLEINRGNLEKAREVLSAPAQAGAPEGLYLAGLTDYLRGDFSSATKMFLRVLDTQAHERAISGRGLKSEGDVGGESPLERAAVKAKFLLYWIASRQGGYSDAVADSYRLALNLPSVDGGRFATERLPETPAGRAVWIDIDRDGRSEILVAEEKGVRLYRRSAAGVWVDAAREAGLETTSGAWDACTTDSDSDGWQDVYLIRNGYLGTGENAFFRNQNGRLAEVTSEVGLSGTRATARALSADLNGDGKADLLEVGNRGPASPAVRLYINEGARFEERAATMGLVYGGNAVDAAVADVDGDGRTDVFVLGWKQPGTFFLNTPDGFVDRTSETGLQGVGGDGFSTLFFDFDRDGWQDLLVTAHAPLELSLNRILHPSSTSDRLTPRLFRNREGRFEDVTAELGLDHHYGIMQAVSHDLDADGWPDLALAQGGLTRQHLEPSLILRNDGGRRFVEWAYLPSMNRPLNASGIAADGNGALFLSGWGVLRFQGS